MQSLSSAGPSCSPSRGKSGSPVRAHSADRALQRCARRAACVPLARDRGGGRRPRGGRDPAARPPHQAKEQDDVDMKSMTLWMQLWSMDD